ncbi:MAG: T9SS type A sorting domain-containing protein [Sphingobacteriaceae bacterium]|nr:T9SS type A sorting domain-containing protein [Sphingobacteriaceae bacterium]
MNIGIKKIVLIGSMLLCAVLLRAQEGLRPMHGNPNLIYSDLKSAQTSKQNHSVSKAAVPSLNIPFFDDFNYACNSAYPAQQWWADSSVYINTGMAKAPMSIGVATFDGLNEMGYPYNPNQNFTATQANDADTLTSLPINLFTSGSQTLQPSDSIALIFYYQQTGNGDSPELQDSLMLDFFSPSQSKWTNRTWSLKGNMNTNGFDTVFKRVFVWVTDTSFFHDGFKFRFRNKAQTCGNFDNWHIDQVFLDKGRSIIGDTAWNDLTIGYVPAPFTKNYSSMPWYQFNANPPKEMATYYSNYIRYNGTSTVNTTYEYRAFDQTNTQVNFVSYGAANLPPFKPGGWQHTAAHKVPSIGYTFTPMTDSTDFTIKHYMQNFGGDISIANDTVYQKQRFRNYFAYDDGNCETGYYVMGTGGRMAYKYDLNVTDTLRGMRIYFDPVGGLSLAGSSFKMKINIYTDSGFGPGTKIFTSDSIYPKYSQTGHNKFYEYKFITPQILSAGVYYIGIQQFVAGGITIGFDRNYNFSQKLFYDSGSGWTQSSYYGAVMMRPVFGPKIIPPVGIKESAIENSTFKVYPNPSDDLVKIWNDNDLEVSYSVLSIDGKTLLSGTGSEIDTQSLTNGIYLLVLSSQNGIQQRQKLIIQH